MLRVSNKGKGTTLHNNIKGKGTMMHNNNKMKVQICIRYTLLVMFYYALTPISLLVRDTMGSPSPAH